MKKAMLLVTILLSLCFTGGCSEPKSTMGNKGLDNSNSSAKNYPMVVPCLVYQEQGDKIVALIANWKIDSGTLEISKNQAFSCNKSENVRFPLTWDGANNFVFLDSCVPSDQYKSSIKLVPPSSLKQEVFLGENIKLAKIIKTSGELDRYAVEIEFNGEKISKDIRLDMKYQDESGKSYDLNPYDLSFAYSDGKNAYFIFARSLNNDGNLISVKYNLVTDEKSLNIIATDKQINAEALFLQDSVRNIGGKFYSHTSCGISMFDVNQNKFEYLKNLSDHCKNYIPSTVKNDVYPSSLGVIGVYSGILIVSVPVNTGKTNEALYCAVKDNKIIAAIYIQDHVMQLMDANKIIKSEINLKKLKLNSSPILAFPSNNATNW